MTFEGFKEIVRNALESGEIEISKPLSDLDMAVQYAIGIIGDKRGYPVDISLDELRNTILTFADGGIFDRDDGWFYD